MKKQYDIAAYIWPSYSGKDPRSRIFWAEGDGEWQSVRNTGVKENGYCWSRKPLWGYQDEADSKVMEQQIDEAVKHGVNVFIYDWYWYDGRPFLEQCLNDGFLKAGNKDKMRFYLMWANHDATYLWDVRNSNIDEIVWRGSVDRDEFNIVVERIIKQYFSQENYYKIDAKPVFMIYDLDKLIQGLGGLEATKEALEYFREETKKAGFPGLHLQLTACGERMHKYKAMDGSEMKASTKEIVETLGFDSITNYQFAQYLNIDRDYLDILEDAKKEYCRVEREYTVPYFPQVSIGWDNNPRYINFKKGITTNNTPENFKKGLKMAKEYADRHTEQPPLIILNSWNEWTETSYLLPDDVNGYGYLEAVKSMFKEQVD